MGWTGPRQAQQSEYSLGKSSLRVCVCVCVGGDVWNGGKRDDEVGHLISHLKIKF